jgi:H+/Cl- antiporter ClcA
MITKQHYSLASGTVARHEDMQNVAKDTSRSRIWTTTLALCGIGGLVCGMAGSMLSLLAACHILSSSRILSLIVTALITFCFGLLIGFAHSLDRLHAIKADEQGKKPARPEKRDSL